MSVIVRTVGRPELARALAAVAAQDHPALETVVVHARPGLVLPTVDGLPRLTEVAPGPALPRAEAANAGLAAAHGERAIFLDEDDEFDAGHIAGLVAGCAGEIDAATYSDARVVDALGAARATIGGEYTALRLYAAGLFCIHSCLFPLAPVRREHLRFDPALPMYEDWDFWIALEPYVRYRNLPRCTAVYHAESGASGAGVGANRGGAAVAGARRAVFDKWRERIAERGGPTEDLLAVGRELMQKGLWTDAVGVLNAVLTREPAHPDALALGGTAALQAGDAKGAVTLLERALEAGERPALHYNLALAHEAGGAPEAALRHARRAVELAPGYEPGQRLLARYRTIP